MWNLFDQWIVWLAIGWASWWIIKILTKKSYLSSCAQPCDKKKIFNRSDLVAIRRKRI